MKAGDVILSFGGEPIEDTRELVRVVAETEVGRTVDVVVFREGAEERLKGRHRPPGGDLRSPPPPSPQGEEQAPQREEFGARHDRLGR